MKRVMLFMAAMLIGVSPLFAQSLKVDKDAIAKKIEVSNADIANAKKNTKAATWLTRGGVFFEAGTAASSGWYGGLEGKAMELLFGKAKIGEAKVGSTKYVTKTYPYITAYLLNDKVEFWDVTQEIEKGALETAAKAYQKAAEIDSKSQAKALKGLEDVVNAYKQEAANMYSQQRYKEAADRFRSAYQIQMEEPINVIDTLTMYNAGFIYTVANELEKGEEGLNLAIKNGYDNDGEAYYYLFHCYKGLDRMEDADVMLQEGLAKYPNNARIVECLITLYSLTPGKNAKDIIPIVERTIAKDEKNPDLWLGLGRVYDQLEDKDKKLKIENSDKAIEAFKTATKLAPNEFVTNYSLGFMYHKKGVLMYEELSENTSISVAEVNKAITEISDVFFMAIAPLEKALEKEPKDVGAIELLRSVTFRLRERSEEIMAKYTKYDALYKSLNTEQ